MANTSSTYRYSKKVVAEVMRQARGSGVTRHRLITAAGAHDKATDNDRYLGRRELEAGLAALLAHKNDTEKLLDAPKQSFERLARQADTRTGPKLPRLAALDFRQGISAPSAQQVAMDEKLDAVAREFASLVRGRRGWSVEIIGADPGKPDLLAGLLPESHASTLKHVGEAYCVVKLKLPVLGQFNFALTRSRLFNEFVSNGRPAKFVDDKARFAMAFIDPTARTLDGSSIELQTSDNWAADPLAPVETADVADVAQNILAEIEQMQALNRRRR